MQGTSSAGRRWPDFGTGWWWSIFITHAVASAWSGPCQTKHWQPYCWLQWRTSLHCAVQWVEPRGCVMQQTNWKKFSMDGSSCGTRMKEESRKPLLLTELSCLRWRSREISSSVSSLEKHMRPESSRTIRKKKKELCQWAAENYIYVSDFPYSS